MEQANNQRANNGAEEEKRAVTSSSSDDDGINGSEDGTESKSAEAEENNAAHAAVKAEYTDHSRDTAGDSKEENSALSNIQGLDGSSKEPTFPVKLHMILSNPGFEDIISWLPHGRSWRILQQKAFEERVIPQYFRHGRYSSFARQVNGWGFRRINHGSDYNSYYHELFLRGHPSLCGKMRRLTSKDIAKRKTMQDEPPPDFYALSREHPLPEAPPNKTMSGDAQMTLGVNATLGVPQAFSANNSGLQNSAAPPESELTRLERRRVELLENINSLLLQHLQGSNTNSTPQTNHVQSSQIQQDLFSLLISQTPQAVAPPPPPAPSNPVPNIASILAALAPAANYTSQAPQQRQSVAQPLPNMVGNSSAMFQRNDPMPQATPIANQSSQGESSSSNDPSAALMQLVQALTNSAAQTSRTESAQQTSSFPNATSFTRTSCSGSSCFRDGNSNDQMQSQTLSASASLPASRFNVVANQVPRQNAASSHVQQQLSAPQETAVREQLSNDEATKLFLQQLLASASQMPVRNSSRQPPGTGSI